MDGAAVVAALGVGLLIAELLLSTGGVLAVLGALGLVAGGVLALDSNSSAADYVGPALIALGLLSLVAFYFVTRKVIEAHRDQPVRTGTEELVGSLVEARSDIDPDGRVWAEGTVWSARLADGGAPIRLGDRVRVDAMDGLTLVVHPEPTPAGKVEGGAS
jgi:membrane-bound serine protease (ClpP class)